MPDPTPDPRATVELCERLQREWTEWTDIEKAPTKEGTLTLFRCIQDYLNGAEAIIRDLRRLVEAEAENARLNEMAMNYQRLCDERYAKLGRDRDAARRRLVKLEAAVQAVCDPEVKRWSGVYSGEPWYSVPGELLTALANALAHREGQ